MEQRNNPKSPENREHETGSERPYLSSSRQPMASPYTGLPPFSVAGNTFIFHLSLVFFFLYEYWIGLYDFGF